MMETALAHLRQIEILDTRQAWKVKYKLSEIMGISFFAMVGNANDPEDIELFCRAHEGFLRQYFALENGIPSHDTIERAFAMVSPKYLQSFHRHFNDLMNTNEGEKVRKILALDGKTQRGSRNSEQKANHIVSAVDEDGFCLGEERVDDKSNEITAIPNLLDTLNIKGHILRNRIKLPTHLSLKTLSMAKASLWFVEFYPVTQYIITTGAMGTQRDIVKKIRQKKADYVLALKGNQASLYEDVKLYFEDADFLSKCGYCKTVEKARGSVETREYWQTENIGWLSQKKDWAGLKSIAMTRNTILKKGVTTTENRYFISSLPTNAKEIARAIRTHWMVESYHWHLDVTFREDADHTLNKQVAFNMNIMRKLALNLLKLLDVGRNRVSLAKKRFVICCEPQKYFSQILQL